MSLVEAAHYDSFGPFDMVKNVKVFINIFNARSASKYVYLYSFAKLIRLIISKHLFF